MKEAKKLLITLQSAQLRAFQKKYPTITSADMQSWLLGYQCAIDSIDEVMNLQQEESIQMDKLSYGTYPESNIR